MEKIDSVREKIILDYLKKYSKDYRLEELREKIVSTGYSEEETDSAISYLGLKKDKIPKIEVPIAAKKILEASEAVYKGEKEDTNEFKRTGEPVKRTSLAVEPASEEEEKPDEGEIKEFAKTIDEMKKQIGKAIIGQEEVVDSLIGAILCDGHVLLEGVPGIAKTLAIKALAKVSGCEAKRIQFTVDLLPTDILGLTTYTPQKGFEIVKGPIFANFLIADEINRSPPKTQSALIEAMQEKQVTIGKQTFPLPLPFFVMATENPLETGGVYTLPEAQIDRFLFKIIMGYPKIEDEGIIMAQNTTLKKFEDFKLDAVTSPKKIIEMQSLTKKIYLSKKIREYILGIINLTRTREIEHGSYVDWGASPRATIALFIASKSRALMNGRNFVVPRDVKESAYEVLRHRIILSYKARVEGVTSDKIITELLKKVKVP